MALGSIRYIKINVETFVEKVDLLPSEAYQRETIFFCFFFTGPIVQVRDLGDTCTDLSLHYD